MKKKLAVLAATMLVAGALSAQMKVTQSTPQGTQTQTVAPGAQPTPSLESARRIQISEAQKLVSEGKAIYVDVRGKDQYDKGHIKGAYHVPGSQLVSRLRDLPPGKMIITYCACSADQSSARAVLELNKRGVKNTAALAGGWSSWLAQGLPTATSN